MKALLLSSFILFSLSISFLPGLKAQETESGKRIFPLGQVNITGTRDSLRANKISAGTINLYNRTDVAQALNLLPGITLTAVGPRNESAITVRGFDIRQVPVYLDGIPLYVPYDGYVDLARFNTFNLSEIVVSKGYSSILYGPNAAGGAINLISRKPVNPFEINAVAGYLSGGYRLNTNIGGSFGKFYYELSASQLKKDYFPLSSSFVPTTYEDGGHRDNSYSDDQAISGKIGFTPAAGQEYAVGYSYQHGKKGTPVYAGNDPLNSLLKNPRFWEWPNWDTQSVYLLSNNRINATNLIKTRWYYDQFKNTINSYDNSSYEAMTRPYAFKSIYDDYTLGSSVTFENTSLKNNTMGIAGHFKQDVHREHNAGEPVRRSADNNFTIGAEDTYQITPSLKINGGLSYMKRQSTQAQQYTNNVVTDLPANNNDAWNAQGLIQYDLDSVNVFSFSVARKTRFATIKDRYSYRFGTAIPNPDLKAENALNYDLTYRTSLAGKLTVQASGFYSKINNSIQMVSNVQTDPATGTQVSQVQNVGRAEYYGAEFAAGYAVARTLRLDANYTYIKRNNLSSPQIYLTDVPENKIFAAVQYTPFSKLYIVASEEYNTKRYSTSYGTVSGDFYLSNVKAHLSIVKSIAIEGGVNNLFDRNYTLVEGYPREGRNYFVNLSYSY
jgi:iron complex outermembrane receptor protein